MTYTATDIMKMVNELAEEKAKTVKVPHYYKRNGKMVERWYPDYVTTDRYNELSDLLKWSPDTKVFRCSCCKIDKGYFDLERWMCDFNLELYLCSVCYEGCSGDDL